MGKTYYPARELVALQVRHVGRLTKAALIEQGDLEYWAAPETRFKTRPDVRKSLVQVAPNVWAFRDVGGSIPVDATNSELGRLALESIGNMHWNHAMLVEQTGKWEANGQRRPVYAATPEVPHTVRGYFPTTPLGLPEGYVSSPDARRPDRHQVMQATMPDRPRSGGDLDPCAGKAPSGGLDRLMDELRPLELELGQLQFKAARSQASKVERKRIRQLEYIILCKTIDSKSRGASLTARKDSFQQSHSHAPKGKATPAQVEEEIARD